MMDMLFINTILRKTCSKGRFDPFTFTEEKTLTVKQLKYDK